MPYPSYGSAAARGADGRIYVVGYNQFCSCSTTFAYNPSSNTWSNVAAIPTGRDFLAATADAAGAIYAVGGGFENGIYSTATEILHQ